MDLFRKQCVSIGIRIENWICNVSKESENPFWLLDKLFILAGVHFAPRNRWNRFGWALYRSIPYSHMLIFLVGLLSAVIFKEDSITIIQLLITVVYMSECFVKHHLLLRHSAGILELRNYLESPTFGSGDSNFDEFLRKRFRRNARVLIVGISLVIFVQQVLTWVPNEQQSNIFYIHPWVGSIWGENVALAIRIWFISIFTTVWLFKLYGCTVTSVVLMMGFETEQRVLAHNFARIQDGLQDLHQSYWDSELARKQFWKRMRTLLGVILNQQQFLLSHLRELQPLIENLFFLIYYIALVIFGSTLFIIFAEPISFIYIAIIGTFICCASEVYILCYFMDSLKDAFDSIVGPALHWCARLPYSEDHHGTYIEMRTSLQIIAACSRNIVSFSCAGISDISVAVFADLLNICYSVFTFLRDFI